MQKQKLRRLEYLAWTVTLVCAGWSGMNYELAHAAVPGRDSKAPAEEVSAPGSQLGALHIPAIGLSVPVFEDDADDILRRGVGHIQGTAMPGGLGTVGLAGHRDTFLRPLQNIKPTMRIDVSRGTQVYQYVVDSTEIVKPEDVQVLATRDTPGLAIVTCYPFHYIGAAPMRFIVHAHLVSLTPTASAQ